MEIFVLCNEQEIMFQPTSVTITEDKIFLSCDSTKCPKAKRCLKRGGRVIRNKDVFLDNKTRRKK